MAQARPSFSFVSIVHPYVVHFSLPKSRLVVRVAVRSGSHLHVVARITTGSVVYLHLLLATWAGSSRRVAVFATLLAAKVWLIILGERHDVGRYWILRRDLQ